MDTLDSDFTIHNVVQCDEITMDKSLAGSGVYNYVPAINTVNCRTPLNRGQLSKSALSGCSYSTSGYPLVAVHGLLPPLR